MYPRNNDHSIRHVSKSKSNFLITLNCGINCKFGLITNRITMLSIQRYYGLMYLPDTSKEYGNYQLMFLLSLFREIQINNIKCKTKVAIPEEIFNLRSKRQRRKWNDKRLEGSEIKKERSKTIAREHLFSLALISSLF